MLLPVWKIRRELRRLGMQMSQWHWFVFGPMRRRRYDDERHKHTTLTDGQRPLRPDVALVLVYQPDGILPSFLDELRHLWQNNLAPVVVSNCPISDADLKRLAPLCHLIIQRPNYGYDFGGYRDGILTLFENGIRPRNLIIKNDSIWFPVTPDCDLLQRALANEADIFGIFLNEKPRQPHRSHLQSYFYRFNERILNSADFLEYWQNLMMTNNKNTVIRQCEIKLTNWFKSRGFTIDQLYKLSDIQAAIISLDDDSLAQLLQYQAGVETRSSAKLKKILSIRDKGGNWRSLAEALIRSGAIAKYFLITHPLVLIDRLKCPVLKKDRQFMYQLQRKVLLSYGLDRMMSDALSREMRLWDSAAR